MLLNFFARRLATSALLAVSVYGGSACADTLFAADNTTVGLNGVVMLNPATMGVNGTFLTNGPVSGLAANSDTSVYTSVGNQILQYNTSGNVLRTHTGFSADHFDDLSLAGGSLYAVDNTTVGLYGVVIFDEATLGVTSTYQTLVPINGLAAGGSHDSFISIGQSVYHYGDAGNSLGSFTALANDHFDDLFLRGGVLYAVDNTNIGLSGVVALDPATLTILDTFLTSGPVSGITGDDTNLFTSIGSDVFNLDTSGNVLNAFNAFPADHFDDLAYGKTAVPEPGTFAAMGLGLAVLLRRRARK